MKKLTAIFTTIITSFIIMMCGGMNAFAGDVPESLTESKAQVYFGTIEEIGDSSEINGFEVYDYIEVMPVAAIKDNVTQGEKIRYNKVEYNFHYKGKPQKGEIYLFAYYDENNPLDCFCVTAYDTDTLRIVGVDQNDENDMWLRFQKYLNEGKYGEAKIEDITPKYHIVFKLWWIGILIIPVIIYIVVMKLKRRSK